MKRIVKRIVISFGVILAGLLLVFLIGGWCMFGTFIKAAASITKLEDGLYSMEYSGDYGFDEFLEKGGAASDAALAEFLIAYLSRGFYKIESSVQTGEIGCSVICTESELGETLLGRNFDWENGDVLLIHTKPVNGYESTTTCLLDFLGFGEGYMPNGSIAERFQTLAAIYVPLDGMNEKGLMVADLIAGDRETTAQRTGKVNITTTTAIRLLLDRAATVDEAIALLQQYDMNSSIGSAHHLAIADSSGRCVVAEYVGNELLVTEAPIVTNHYLSNCEKYGTGSEQSHKRYDTLAGYHVPRDADTVRDWMKSVAQMNYPQNDGSYGLTLWTVVYHPGSGTAEFYHAENYDSCYRISIVGNNNYIQ